MIHDDPGDDGFTTQDGDWDLVNMQRLSKAVEDTGKDNAEPEPTPTPTPDNNTTPTEPPAAASAATAAAAAAPASRTYAPGQAWSPTPKAASEAEATDASVAPGDGGFEESKSSDEGAGQTPAAQHENAPAVSAAPTPPQGRLFFTVPPAMSTKWHRELCSLAEMGFENTPRNVGLLEKHVVESGNAGMER